MILPGQQTKAENSKIRIKHIFKKKIIMIKSRFEKKPTSAKKGKK